MENKKNGITVINELLSNPLTLVGHNAYRILRKAANDGSINGITACAAFAAVYFSRKVELTDDDVYHYMYLERYVDEYTGDEPVDEHLFWSNIDILYDGYGLMLDIRNDDVALFACVFDDSDELEKPIVIEDEEEPEFDDDDEYEWCNVKERYYDI